MCFVIKIFKIVKNSQATGNETAVVENNKANQRALTAARDFDDHYPGGEGISYQRFLWNDRILRGTPAIRRLPRYQDERFHYPSAEGISNQRFLWNDRILGGTPAIRRLPRHNDERSINEVRNCFVLVSQFTPCFSYPLWHFSEETTYLSASF